MLGLYPDMIWPGIWWSYSGGWRHSAKLRQGLINEAYPNRYVCKLIYLKKGQN